MTVLDAIRSGGSDGNIRKSIEQVRSESDTYRRSQLKKNLLTIMWQGKFTAKNDQGLAALNSLMCIDLDHLSALSMNDLRTRLQGVSWVVAYFLSPSGDGLKVIVKTDNYDKTLYKDFYMALEKEFSDKFGVTVDPNCRSISQGCFISYDPDVYYNPNAQDYHVDCTQPSFSPVTHVNSSHIDHDHNAPSSTEKYINELKIMQQGLTDDDILRILDLKFTAYPRNYVEGNRTHSVFVQAGTICKAGIGMDKAMVYLKSKFLPAGLTDTEVENEVQRAYQTNQHLFRAERGKYKNYENYKKSKGTHLP